GGGADMRKPRVRNIVRERILNNPAAAKGLKQQWPFPADLIAKADVVIDATGRHEKAAPRGLARKWKIAMVQLNNVLDVEETEEGIMQGLKEAALAEGKDYELRKQNAQGDMATVNALVDDAVSQGADLLIAFS